MSARVVVELAGGYNVRLRKVEDNDDGEWEARVRFYPSRINTFEEWVRVFWSYDAAHAWAWETVESRTD